MTLQNKKAIIFDNLIFIVVPKVANTSIKVTIANWANKPFKIGPNGPLVHHPQLFNYDVVQNLKQYTQPKIGFVRDPWSRLVSCYQNKFEQRFYKPAAQWGLSPNSSFEDFINAIDTHWGNFNNHWAPCHLWADYATRVIKFENLKEEWEILRTEYDLPELTHENKTKSKKNWREYYTPTLFAKVKKMYKTDIDQWYADWSQETQ